MPRDEHWPGAYSLAHLLPSYSNTQTSANSLIGTPTVAIVLWLLFSVVPSAATAHPAGVLFLVVTCRIVCRVVVVPLLGPLVTPSLLVTPWGVVVAPLLGPLVAPWRVVGSVVVPVPRAASWNKGDCLIGRIRKTIKSYLSFSRWFSENTISRLPSWPKMSCFEAKWCFDAYAQFPVKSCPKIKISKYKHHTNAITFHALHLINGFSVQILYPNLPRYGKKRMPIYDIDKIWT